MAEPTVVEIEIKPEITEKEGVDAIKYVGNTLRSILSEKRFRNGRKIGDVRHYNRVELKKVTENSVLYNIYYEPRAKVGNTVSQK